MWWEMMIAAATPEPRNDEAQRKRRESEKAARLLLEEDAAARKAKASSNRINAVSLGHIGPVVAQRMQQLTNWTLHNQAQRLKSIALRVEKRAAKSKDFNPVPRPR
ncbi:hypothetical protein JFK97_19165 [Chromobacterium phragmitis]|uniref:hypothetical protein n=1 Tax=Chromobacterium amazonense TaxID=1382803 RepID=UPI0021B7510A|nr:hypothetical protein [Chromobacterium amazonense]MBM2886514.1 hypothetical protein [Chromobacterium amazonense]